MLIDDPLKMPEPLKNACLNILKRMKGLQLLPEYHNHSFEHLKRVLKDYNGHISKRLHCIIDDFLSVRFHDIFGFLTSLPIFDRQKMKILRFLSAFHVLLKEQEEHATRALDTLTMKDIKEAAELLHKNFISQASKDSDTLQDLINELPVDISLGDLLLKYIEHLQDSLDENDDSPDQDRQLGHVVADIETIYKKLDYWIDQFNHQQAYLITRSDHFDKTITDIKAELHNLDQVNANINKRLDKIASSDYYIKENIEKIKDKLIQKSTESIIGNGAFNRRLDKLEMTVKHIEKFLTTNNAYWSMK